MIHLDAFGPQTVGAAPGDRGGIGERDHGPSYARGENGIDAGGRLAVMGARLEGHEEGAASCPIAGLGQRNHFRMGAAVGGVIALSGEPAPGIEDHCSHHRIGRSAAAATGGQLESALHPVKIVAVVRPGGAATRANPSRSRRNLVTFSWDSCS